ncbi:MAG: glycosyltransferase family 2 protein [Bacteroidales bacterium]|nr:glycosyltransferase family 2 protein [Bacteroidales bacterium]
MEKTLTVVVPVYRVEAYIRACLDSLVLEEGMGRLEVIVVNDGTPDRSADIAREYEVRFPGTFRVIDKENGGHGSAWNVGLKAATGRYLAFLDSDDWLEGLPEVMDYLDTAEADLVMTDQVLCFEADGYREKTAVVGLEAGRVYDFETHTWPLRRSGYRQTIFQTCLYRTSLLQPFWPLFQEHTFYDDIILFVAPVIAARTYVYLGRPLYCYRVGREGQTMQPSVLARKMPQQMAQRRYVVAFVEAHPVDGVRKQALLRGIVRRVVKTQYDFIGRLPAAEQKPYLDEWTAFVRLHVPDAGLEARLYGRVPMLLYRLAVRSKNAWGRLKDLLS